MHHTQDQACAQAGLLPAGSGHASLVHQIFQCTHEDASSGLVQFPEAQMFAIGLATWHAEPTEATKIPCHEALHLRSL